MHLKRMVVGGEETDTLNGWFASHSLSVRLLVYSFEHILLRGSFFSAAGSLPFYFALLQRLEKNLRAGLVSMSLGFLLYAIPRSN